MSKVLFICVLLMSFSLIFGQFTAYEVSRTGYSPDLIAFQGRLFDSLGEPLTGDTNIVFSIYSSFSGGTPLWTESRNVTVTDGLFQLNLGDVMPLSETYFSSPTRWLGIKIGTDTEMSPRIRIASVPYALSSVETDPSWDGITNTTSTIGRTGSVGIGTISPNAKLEVVGDALINGHTIGKGGGSIGSNLAVGSETLLFNTTGEYNTAVGKNSLLSNTIGSHNTAVGYATLSSNLTGSANTAIGYQVLLSNFAPFNTGVGYQALRFNTYGAYNAAIGHKALYSNTIGTNNVAIGYESLQANTEGYRNIAIGTSALFSNTTGHSNTACGVWALLNNTTGHDNLANGFLSLYNNSTGNWNTGLGVGALFNNTIGTDNIAIGFYAGSGNINGAYNTSVGNLANSVRSSLTSCTFLGYNSDASLDFLSNSTALGYNATLDSSNQIRIGNSSITNISGSVGWSTFSDGRYKKNVQENVIGLDFIMNLRPVTYQMEVHKLAAVLMEDQRLDEEGNLINTRPNDFDITGRDHKETISYTGFIAQEVESAAKECGFDFSGIDVPQNENGLYSLKYAEFVVPLVKAVQEQQSIIEMQQKQIDELNAAIKELQERLD